jgi:UDP-2,4-diacetamido-2,4,6-trideoxy-beta-L-altropyranose hydrolase
MRVVFRVDSSLQMGTGHVMRCLTLADALQRKGCEIHFVCRELPGHVIAMVERSGHGVSRLPAPAADQDKGDLTATAHTSWLGVPWEDDARETLRALDEIYGVDWLVVDHYALDARWERSLRKAAGKIMVIDDLADRPHDCDLLLDQNFRSNSAGYEQLVPTGCECLLGPRHALLRPEFAELHPLALDKQKYVGDVRKVLVFLGGGDSENVTERVLDVVSALAWKDVSIEVVLGAANPHRERLLDRYRESQQIQFHVHTPHMASLMLDADLSIGAGGGALWERCCLGLPCIVTAIGFNQEEVARQLARHGAILYAGPHKTVSADRWRACLEVAFGFAELRDAMRQRAVELVDGLGAARVASRMLGAGVTLRPVTLEDGPLIFGWRNQPQTRQFFHNPEPLELSGHMEWLQNSLNDPNRHILLGCVGDQPFGVIRYDVVAGQALVSIYLDPEWTGFGMGASLLHCGTAWAKESMSGVRMLCAEVLSGNEASVNAFHNAGYVLEKSTFVCPIAEN